MDRRDIIKRLLNLPIISVVLKYDFYMKWQVNSEFKLDGDINASLMLEDGRMVFGYEDGRIVIFNPNTQKYDNILQGHTGFIRFIKNISSNQIMTGSGDKTVRIWNLNTGKCETILNHNSDIASPEILPDGRIVMTKSNHQIIVWNPENNTQLILSGHESTIWSIALWKDKIISASNDRTLKLWNSVTGEMESSIIYRYQPTKILVNKDKIIVLSWGKQLKIYSFIENKLVFGYSFEEDIRTVTILEDKIFMNYNNKIRIMNINTYQFRDITIPLENIISNKLFLLPNNEFIFNSLYYDDGDIDMRYIFNYEENTLILMNNNYKIDDFFISKSGKIIGYNKSERTLYEWE